jgi:chemotaxis protein CheC
VKILNTSNDLQKLNSVLDFFIVQKTIPSLCSILEEPITHHLRKTQEIPVMNLDLIMPNIEEMHLMSAVYIKCVGDIHMGVLLYMPEKESKTLAAKLLGKPISSELAGIATSSISEIGNILTASLINAISIDMGYKICSSVPGYAVEFFRTLLDAVVSDFGNESDTLIVSNVELHSVNSDIDIHMLLIQDPSEMKKLVI